MIRLICKISTYILGALIGVLILLGLAGQVHATEELHTVVYEGEPADVVRIIDPETGVVCYYLRYAKKGISCVQFKEGSK